MGKFPFDECKIRWQNEANIPTNDKQAIFSDLRDISDIIEEAKKNYVITSFIYYFIL